MMVGSARIFTSPFFTSASRVNAVRPLARVAPTVLEAPVSSCVSSVKVVLPLVRVRLNSVPSLSIRVLETSATLTSSMTCCEPSTLRRLTTFLPPP